MYMYLPERFCDDLILALMGCPRLGLESASINLYNQLSLSLIHCRSIHRISNSCWQSNHLVADKVHVHVYLIIVLPNAG